MPASGPAQQSAPISLPERILERWATVWAQAQAVQRIAPAFSRPVKQRRMISQKQWAHSLPGAHRRRMPQAAWPSTRAPPWGRLQGCDAAGCAGLGAKAMSWQFGNTMQAATQMNVSQRVAAKIILQLRWMPVLVPADAHGTALLHCYSRSLHAHLGGEFRIGPAAWICSMPKPPGFSLCKDEVLRGEHCSSAKTPSKPYVPHGTPGRACIACSKAKKRCRYVARR